MKKEIIGIVFFAIVIFTVVSLASFSPNDPSIHSATAPKVIHNIFGVVGAHTAGLLLGVFGVGAFWVPLLFLYMGVQLFQKQPRRFIVEAMVGGIMLIIVTGSIFALSGTRVKVFSISFSSGGVVGIPIAALFSSYTNKTGAYFLLSVGMVISLLLVTRLSLVSLLKLTGGTASVGADRMRTLLIKWRERRKKAKKRIDKPKKRREPALEAPTVSIHAAPLMDEPEVLPPISNPKPRQALFDFMNTRGGFKLPPVDFLDDPEPRPQSTDSENLKMQSRLLEKKLEDFGVTGQVVTVTPGPVITTFEYAPAPGVKINRIVNLSDDLALALKAIGIRIVAPIPGKAVIGIEIPNETREIVRFKEMVFSKAFEKAKSRLTLCLGKDIVGNPLMAGLEKMPHLLIAGATGTGKSVGLNAMICSILYKATPSEVKFIMVDPKRIELSLYNGIPHLITPVVTDVKKATNALFWAVREMEHRYELLAESKVRNIDQYNQTISNAPKKDGEDEKEPLPYIVIVIDELADLMMVASRDVEVALTRLAQMARAAGIHLILATQRPSVDVLTGIIKANFPTRLSFQVSSKIDSRTIIDTNGAESLLGNGDMLFLPPGTAKLQRVHGAYISETELTRVIDFLKDQKPPEYNETVTEVQAAMESGEETESEFDERYDDAVALVTRTRQASISMIQRHLRIGYNRAARIIETMEKEGVVGPSDGAKPREVLVPGYDEMP